MAVYDLGIIASGQVITTSGFIVTAPYHSPLAYNSNGNYNPIIGVKASGNLDNANVITDKLITFYACALPTGVAAPGSPRLLVENYTSFSDKSTTFTRYTNHLSLIKAIQATPGSVTSTKVQISGNAVYNIYGTHVVSRLKNGVLTPIHYGELKSKLAYRTSAPKPYVSQEDPDFNVSITDSGTSIGSQPTQLFTFKFDNNLYLFDKLVQHSGSLWPGLAASGYVQIQCSGVSSHYLFKKTYASGNPTLAQTNTQVYASLRGATIQYSVPKYLLTDNSQNAKVYEGYDFYFKYINSSGVLSPRLKISYSADQLKSIHETLSKPPSNVNIPETDEWVGPILVNVKERTFRNRLAIGIRDIDLQSIKYKEQGSFVSNIYGSEEPIYALQLDVTEQFQFTGSFSPWDFVKYYIQLNNTTASEWHRISPRSRSDELDESRAIVPKILCLDSQISANDRNTNVSIDNIKYIKFEKPIYNFRVKIDIDTRNSSSRGFWSPLIYDYKVTVLGRSILGNINKYLFT